jgi:hypothetical protein
VSKIKKISFQIHESAWYWVGIPSFRLDWLRPWPAAAICEVENDGSGFAVNGKEIIKGACTRIEYTAKKDGVTREVDVDGWEADGHPGARITMFDAKQKVTVLAMDSQDYPTADKLTDDFFTKEQLALLEY